MLDGRGANNSPTQDSEGIARSKSRYHRKPGSSAGPLPSAVRPYLELQGDIPARNQRYTSPSQSTTPRNPVPIVRDQPLLQQHPTRYDSEGYSQTRASPRDEPVPLTRERVQTGELNYPTGTDPTQRTNPNYDASRNQKPVPVSSIAKPQPPPERIPPRELFPSPQPTDRSTRPQGSPRPNRLQPKKSRKDLREDDDDEDDGGCFGLFKRKRGEPITPVVEKTSISGPMLLKAEPPPVKTEPIVRGTDAPVSAVNAGDRHVLVEFGRTKTVFPVTPSTTPIDLISNAAASMSEHINVKSAVLLESFRTVGVQRPLRQYEHVRDVMNSWDNDRQNSLLLVDPGTGSSEVELSLTGVPEEKPGDVSWMLSYSQKVGKWDTRCITLKSDGQITCAKDPEKLKDAINVCHLSDFDVYTPTPEKLKQKIRPPKRHCFAIKSQQKSSMFESTHSFVHFFSTGDRFTADSFYRAMQGWRSWYLVNVMGEGKDIEATESTSSQNRQGSGMNHGLAHRTKESVGSQFQTSLFKPPVNPDQLGRNSVPRTDLPSTAGALTRSTPHTDTNVLPTRRPSIRKSPPVALQSHRALLEEDEPLGNFNGRSSFDRRRNSIEQERTDIREFKNTGLLGRTHSQRQKDIADNANPRQQPFARGPNLLKGGLGTGNDVVYPTSRPDSELQRYSSIKKQNMDIDDRCQSGYSPDHAHGNSIGLGRSNSRARESPSKPLIDFTAQNNNNNNFFISPGVYRNSSVSRSGTRSGRPPTAPSRSPEAFTGDGLLAGSQAQQGWGSGNTGRGVIDGSRAGGRPMLNLAEQSMFPEGSLLNRVEKEQGPQGPVIDREKRVEKTIKVGEMV